VSARRGDLRAAEAELRSAFDLARQEVMAFALPSLLLGTVDVLLERRLDDVAEFVEAPDHPAVQGTSYPTAMFLEVRGRLRVSRGGVETGVDDLRRCGELVTALHSVSPAASGWRSALALALAESAPEEARRLGADDLRLARRGGLARETGIALRTVALVDSPDALISRLRESAAVLATAEAPLEHARTLVELGAALRRGRERVAAQEPLRAALDLAHRCGADRLAERAENELTTAGFRPRRRALTGLDALTPSEARVARHAAAGMSNREIAQALFVTAKTVENQLTIVYQKLEVRGREELTALLGDRPTA
jgi:DNA-binding CsgD family transcriptional regulator